MGTIERLIVVLAIQTVLMFWLSAQLLHLRKVLKTLTDPPAKDEWGNRPPAHPDLPRISPAALECPPATGAFSAGFSALRYSGPENGQIIDTCGWLPVERECWRRNCTLRADGGAYGPCAGFKSYPPRIPTKPRLVP